MGLVFPQLSLKKMVPLCRQLATTYEAGLPLLQGFEAIKRESRDTEVRELLTRIQDSIRDGDTLAEAVRAQERYLPPYVIESIAAGEAGGRLDMMFRDLADYFEDRMRIRRSIVKALFYPVTLMVVAWFLGTFALKMVRSAIGSIMGTSPTFSFGGFFVEYGWFQAKWLTVFAIIAGICVLLARLGVLKWIWGAVSTYIWPLAPITRRFALARFFRSLALLIQSGLPIHQCIERSASVTMNPYIAQDMLKAVPHVRNGETLTDAFSHSHFLLPTAREMIYVGEESGEIDKTLRKVSQYYLEEASHAVDKAVPVLYYIVYLAVAGAIGYIVFQFYMSYFGALGNLMG